MAQDAPDAVLLDLGLPGRDGLELVPVIARTPGIALLVVSARDATEDKVAALDLGADDYVTKPFDSEELLARLRVEYDRRSLPVLLGGIVACGLLLTPLAYTLNRDIRAMREKARSMGIYVEGGEEKKAPKPTAARAKIAKLTSTSIKVKPRRFI